MRHSEATRRRLYPCVPGDLAHSRLDPRYWLCTNCGATIEDARAERDLDDYLDNDDRGYPTEDDDRIPPPEEGEPE